MSETNASAARRALPAALIAALLLSAPLAAQSPAPLELATFPRTALEISHRDEHHALRKFAFEVWVADTQPRAEQGLMFVSDLPDTRGMVFPLSEARVENMWMRNTYIELDMLFIGADGKVVKIIERAQPLSDAILSSDKAVNAVLELKGGEVKKLGLAPGDTVSWKKPATAAAQ